MCGWKMRHRNDRSAVVRAMAVVLKVNFNIVPEVQEASIQHTL